MKQHPMRLMTLFAAAAFSAIGMITPCAADDPSTLAGNWVGTISGFGGDPMRYLQIPKVNASGQVQGSMGTAQTFRLNNIPLTIDGERVEFMGANGNGAKLVREGDTLVGKWKNGNNNDRWFDITYKRAPDDPVFANAAAAAPPSRPAGAAPPPRPAGAAAPAAAQAGGALSANAKMIYDAALSDMRALRPACEGGRPGVTQLVSKSVGQLMAAGKLAGNPTPDAQAAGEAVGRKCAEFKQ